MDYLGGENPIFYVLMFLWIGVIICLSSGKNSVSSTLPFFIRVVESLLPGASSTKIGRYFVIIRKISHFAGYAILAFLASLAFSNSSFVSAAHYWHVIAFTVTFVVAAADETRQHFDSERVGSISDVVLDCVGGTAGIFLFWVLAKW